MSREDEFREAVKVYIGLHDEIQKTMKELRDVKKRKEDLGATILDCMREMDIDVCQLPDGGRLVRKQTKKVESLKKNHILKEIASALGDEVRAEAVVNNIFSQRAVAVSETLSRTLK
jgi:hypothetical protein